jgi:hypothetical protein
VSLCGAPQIDFAKLSAGDSWSALKIGTAGLGYGASCPAGAECCLEALPCVAPSCSLPAGFGWTFVLVLLGCSALYLGAGVAHAVKGRGVPLSAGAMQLVPHAESWVALWGLVQDGCAFTAARWTAYREGRGYQSVVRAHNYHSI